ncbi:MAG TPA: NAD(P)-binding domain-containing protein [Acidimicrobiales bacterium]|nr:NAD(P)-binding domain-containing protein [Acidimicrobiales bacterium]
MRIAVLGMGQMGRALATRLAGGGHEVTVWNRTPGRAADVLAAGATEASSAASAVAGAEVVITMLADDAAVRAVADDIEPALGEQAVYVDCSTVSPALAAELAGRFTRFASLPVMGSPDAVRAGTAAYALGAPDAVAADLEPVLDSLSSARWHFERAELAVVAKVTGNYLLLTGLVNLGEAVAVARAGGLGDDDIRRMFAEHPLVAPALRNRFEAVLTGTTEGWFALSLGAKDVGLALAMGATAGVRLDAGEATHAAYERAAAEEAADADIAAVGRLYRA